MRINDDSLKKACKKRGLPLTTVLRNAGISRTAYYHLRAKDSLLPKSIIQLASTLGVRPSEFLREEDPRILLIRRLQVKLEELVSKYPQASRENLWHTLLLLEEQPGKRLERALRRGKHIY